MKTKVNFLLTGILTLVLAACGSDQQANTAAQSKKEIIIGTTVGDFADMVRDEVQPALEKKGYSVKLIEFTDYVRPNMALADKSIDINVFQHKPYLDEFKASHKLNLTEAFQVPTGPLGIYAGKAKQLNQVHPGSTVSVPNDPSNQARALVMLDLLGWIKLKDNIDLLSASVNDIQSNIKQVKLVPLEAAQLPRSRADVDFAIINGNFATSSGLKFASALFLEPGYTYVNWAAIRTDDKNTQWVKDITDAYNSDAFKQYASKRFAGYKYPQSWHTDSALTASAASN